MAKIGNQLLSLNDYTALGYLDAQVAGVPFSGSTDAAAPLNLILATNPTLIVLLRSGTYQLLANVVVPANVVMVILPGVVFTGPGILSAAASGVIIDYGNGQFAITGNVAIAAYELDVTGGLSVKGTPTYGHLIQRDHSAANANIDLWAGDDSSAFDTVAAVTYRRGDSTDISGQTGLNADVATVVAGHTKLTSDLIVAGFGNTLYALLADTSRNLYAAADANIGGRVVLSTAISKIIPGATSISLRNNADSANNLIVTDAGIATARLDVVATRSLRANGGVPTDVVSSSALDAVASGARLFSWGPDDATGGGFEFHQKSSAGSIARIVMQLYPSGGWVVGGAGSDPGITNLSVVGKYFQGTAPLMQAPHYGRPAQQTNTTVTLINAYAVGASDASFDVVGNVNVTASATAAMTMTCTYNDENNTGQVLDMKFTTIGSTLMVISMTASLVYEGIANRIRCKAGTTITIATAATVTGITYTCEATITQVQ